MKRIIYQTLTRLWGHGKFSDFDDRTFEYLRSLGVDYIWYTGIPRHATGEAFVKGDPGSPYAVCDWFDVNPYLADNEEERMQEFESLVHRTHDAGFKLLIDYIPNHVAPNYIGGIRHHDYCDGDWTDTLKNDWHASETYDEMLKILRFWASKGVDGFRCDMVELVPAELLGRLIHEVKKDYPSLMFVAEVYNKDGYRHYLENVGFDLLYDKSGLYDTLRNISCHNATTKSITWNWQYLHDMQPKMLNFLENHDEQRIAAPEFLGSAHKSYAALAVSMLFNTAPFMLYFGQELGENASEGAAGRTSIFNWSSPAMISHLNCYVHLGMGLTPLEDAVLNRYREMLSYAKLPQFAEGKCWDLCYWNMTSQGFDADRHFAFLRFDDSAAYLVVCNFSDYPSSIHIAIPPELSRYCGERVHDVSVPAWDAVVIGI